VSKPAVPSEAKKASPPPVAVAAPVTAPPVAAAPAPTAKAARAPEARSRLPLFLIAALVLILAGAGGFYAWWELRGPGSNDRAGATEGVELVQVFDERAIDAARRAESESAAAATTAADAATAPAAGPSREELLAQIDNAVSARTEAVEASLRDQYDKELKALREQLAASEQQRVEREAALREAQRRVAEVAVADPAPDLPASSSATPAVTSVSERTAPASPVASQPAASSPAPSPSTTAPSTTAPSTTAQTRPPAASPSSPAPSAAASRPTTDGAVRLGQLVEAGAGVVAPRLKTRPQPQYPMVAKRLGREADVDVMVLVDENGAVVDTQIRNPVGYGFDESAVRAARRTEFYPATKNNVRVKMWVPLKIAFKNE
jgi:protein TonB